MIYVQWSVFALILLFTTLTLIMAVERGDKTLIYSNLTTIACVVGWVTAFTQCL